MVIPNTALQIPVHTFIFACPFFALFPTLCWKGYFDGVSGVPYVHVLQIRHAFSTPHYFLSFSSFRSLRAGFGCTCIRA